MKTLPDEIAAALPALMKRYPGGPLAAHAAEFVAADVPNTRAAFDALETDGRAKIVRRARGLHLVPADYPGLICRHCRAEYMRGKKSKRVTCSQACAVAYSWTDPETAAKRTAAIIEERRTPEARERARRINKARWSRPGEREKLAEQNRQRWADPYQNAKQSVGISRANGSPENRAKISKRMKARWSDPKGRQKLIDGIRKSKSTPEARAKFSKLLKERWENPIMREKFVAANREKNRRKSEEAKARRESQP